METTAGLWTPFATRLLPNCLRNTCLGQLAAPRQRGLRPRPACPGIRGNTNPGCIARHEIDELRHRAERRRTGGLPIAFPARRMVPTRNKGDGVSAFARSGHADPWPKGRLCANSGHPRAADRRSSRASISCPTSRICRRCARQCRTLSSASRPGCHKTPEAWARLPSGRRA